MFMNYFCTHLDGFHRTFQKAQKTYGESSPSRTSTRYYSLLSTATQLISKRLCVEPEMRPSRLPMIDAVCIAYLL